MGVPYQSIGIRIGVLLGIIAFLAAESVRGRILIITAMILLFLLPSVWPHSTARFISFFAWIVFGLGCYVFVKYRGFG